MKTNPPMTTLKTVNTTRNLRPAPPWLETEAKVTSCHYESARMLALNFGIFFPSTQFLISFTYYAHGKTFGDQFNSPVAIGQNETFPILYNPLNPQQNSRSAAVYSRRGPIAVCGIAASIICSLLFLVAARGCL